MCLANRSRTVNGRGSHQWNLTGKILVVTRRSNPWQYRISKRTTRSLDYDFFSITLFYYYYWTHILLAILKKINTGLVSEFQVSNESICRITRKILNDDVWTEYFITSLFRFIGTAVETAATGSDERGKIKNSVLLDECRRRINQTET